MTADAYAKDVSYALRDLPWSQRRDLVAELREHLAELPPDTNLVERLGAPDKYAAEMRAAAGLERRRGPIAFLRARRPRNLVLAALALTAAGFAIGAIVWIATYQPLQSGNASYMPGAIDSPTGDGSYYVFRQGKPFAYGLTIWNSGRYTVRVVGVPVHLMPQVKFRVRVSGPATYAHGGIPPGISAFHPFELRPGEMRAIYLDGVYGKCGPWKDGYGTNAGLDALPLQYKFLWLTKTASIPLPSPFVFVFKKRSCLPAKR